MKCLNRVEMQEYIDNETTSYVIDEIAQHLEVCEECSFLHQMAIEDKNLINRILDITFPENESEIIPEFKYPGIKIKRPVFIRVAVLLAAAALIVFIFLFRFDREPVMAKMPESEILMHEFYDGKDLNKLWHDKSQILIIEDGKGNVIQSIITY
jgi:hypothetical protein